MNKRELADKVAKVADLSQAEAHRAVTAVFDLIHEAVAAGDRVALAGHGVYEKISRAARTGRNPATGATIDIAAAEVPKFRAGTDFKAKVNPTPDVPPSA